MIYRYQKNLVLFIFALFSFSTLSFADKLIIEPNAGREPLLSAIKNAKSSIDVVMYGLTDESFTQALINAKNSGKNVQVLLEPQPYKAADENTAAITQLKNFQMNLREPDPKFKLTHQKTLLFDHNEAV